MYIHVTWFVLFGRPRTRTTRATCSHLISQSHSN